MMTPLAAALEEAHPSHEVWLATDSTYASGALIDIAKRNVWDRIVDIPVALATTRETAETQGFAFGGDVTEHPLVQRADAILDLNNACLLVERAVPDPPHRLDIWASVAGVEVRDPRPVYRTTRKEREWAKTWLRFKCSDGRPIVGLAPVAVDPGRRLPSESARAIMDALITKAYRPILLDAHASIDGHLDANGLTFPQIAAVIERLDAVVAVDSGLLHVAGALGRPLVGLFGSIPATRRMAYFPGMSRALQANVPCAPCWYRQGCRRDPDPRAHFACMKGFSAERVVREVEMVIAGNSSPTDSVE